MNAPERLPTPDFAALLAAARAPFPASRKSYLRSERHAELLARGRAVRCALAQRLCEEDQALAEGAEVAFFPPVTGG